MFEYGAVTSVIVSHSFSQPGICEKLVIKLLSVFKISQVSTLEEKLQKIIPNVPENVTVSQNFKHVMGDIKQSLMCILSSLYLKVLEDAKISIKNYPFLETAVFQIFPKQQRLLRGQNRKITCSPI